MYPLYKREELNQMYYVALMAFCAGLYLIFVEELKKNFKPSPHVNPSTIASYVQNLQKIGIRMLSLPQKPILLFFVGLSMVSLLNFMVLIQKYQNMVYKNSRNGTSVALELFMTS